MTNYAELKTKWNTLSVTKSAAEFSVKGYGLSPLNSSE